LKSSPEQMSTKTEKGGELDEGKREELKLKAAKLAKTLIVSVKNGRRGHVKNLTNFQVHK